MAQRLFGVLCTACLVLGGLGGSAGGANAAPKLSPEAERFFESRVRPLLVKRCQSCHGAAKQEGGLRLDSRAGLLKGADSGPVVVPGKPAESRLLEVLAWDPNDVQMPPKQRLPDEEIATFKTWIRIGAPWPSSAGPSAAPSSGSKKIDYTQARAEHWAYRPVEKPALPAVRDSWRLRNPVDAFIEARLERQGLSLADEADRRTLIRRVSLDLVGVPPTFDEVEAFVNDPAPDAYERLVDRLLASPLYGQRWGRHWLDVARYADTKGYVFAEETRYPYSYTYRDYVIRAFNEDVPYDRFIIEQIAADQVDPSDGEKLAALGFLTVGRRFRNSVPDIIDDRIDVVTRGLMAMTMACARCHEHKYDPIPTEDYYSLYGVFASCYEPELPPLVRPPVKTEAYLAYKKELDKRQQALDQFVSTKADELRAELRTAVADYLMQVVKTSGRVRDDFYISFQKGDPRPQIVNRWKEYLAESAKRQDPVFAPWHALAALQETEFAQQAPKVLERLARQADEGTGPPVNRLILDALRKDESLKSMYDVARIYGRVLADVDKQFEQAKKQPGDGKQSEEGAGDQTTTAALPNADAEALRQVLYAEGSPTALSREEAVRLFDRVSRNKMRDLGNQVERWRLQSPAAPPRAMVLLDRPKPVTPRVFIRGNPARRGAPVPRRFPHILSDGTDGVFTQGSGRLELARAIASAENPLTSRVFVNRVWLWHFGRGLVATPSDFGRRSEPPTHPQLLDWLASRFVEEGWSVKWLHRTIVLSATYRQSSLDRPDCRAKDPDNRLWWRMPVRRLDFEAMRDAMLFVTGELDPAMERRPVDLLAANAAPVRTVYGLVNRNNLPGLYRTFDFPSPDSSSPQRPHTIVPQQALYAMNAPFVMDRAARLVALPEVASAGDVESRIRALYRSVFAREPEPHEISLGTQYIEAQSAEAGNQAEVWTRYAQVLLMTNEFLFVD